MSKNPPRRPIRVLSLVPRAVLLPFHSGGEIRVATLMRRLIPEFEFHILSFFPSGGKLDRIAAALELEARCGLHAFFCERTPGLAPDPDKPMIAADYWDPSMVRALRAAIVERRIDVVQVEFTQMAQYARHAADLAPVVMTEHDSSVLSPGASYYRTGDDGIEHSRRTRSYLEDCFSHCRRLVVLSAADARRLEPLAGPGKIRVVPTGTETERIAFKPLEGRRAAGALFIGHYPHYPNEDAAVFLCREVLPRLKRAVAGATVSLVGSAPTAAVRALAGSDVDVIGEVADVAPHLWSAGVFIAPMRLGFGIKGKVLEAFSAGLPVVATPEACEAMPGLRDGRELLIARGSEELAAAAARLVGDRPFAARLARAARRYVVSRFDWERQARLLRAVLREAADERGAATADRRPKRAVPAVRP
ncbi:MAG: glycosyltransferase family 4 protein [Elusimicrobiota bacterium]